MLAIGTPTSTSESARPRFSGRTSPAATTAPIPKNTPCGSPAVSRAANRSSWLGASADAVFPKMNRPVIDSNMVLRRTRIPAMVSSGAPMTTPRE